MTERKVLAALVSHTEGVAALASERYVARCEPLTESESESEDGNRIVVYEVDGVDADDHRATVHMVRDTSFDGDELPDVGGICGDVSQGPLDRPQASTVNESAEGD